jgi:putative two-component system hydrogenase maturation factor HypX/HoxX
MKRRWRCLPDLILAPFLKRAIPEAIWSRHVCLIVHPGIVGDRGPSALDWAIQQARRRGALPCCRPKPRWMPGRSGPRRPFRCGARKSSIYRNEVTEAAVRAVIAAVDRYFSGNFTPQRVPGKAHALMKQADRAIDWAQQTTVEILAKLNAADGFPGVADQLFGQPCHLFDAWPEATLRGEPGALLGRRRNGDLPGDQADGASGSAMSKRPAASSCRRRWPARPRWNCPNCRWPATGNRRRRPGRTSAYEEAAGVGFLAFEFYNGAMSTAQCQRLTEAFQWATTRPTKVIVLRGGSDFWSNGIHLNTIEAAESPADESWANINAIDDLAEAILRCETQLTVAALAGNAGAGGCFLARAADFVWVRDGVMLNPHYKNMGNLYGSEFWTYLLPPRVGDRRARAPSCATACR